MTVATKSLLRRITAALGALDIADGPMSRLDAARRLLTFAFANDIVIRIKIEAIRDQMEQKIVK